MSNASRSGDGLPSLGAVIRHQWLVVVASAAICLGLAVGYGSAVQQTYTSESRVLLSPAPGNPLTSEASGASGTQLTIAMETEAGIVRTPEVEQRAAEIVGRTVPGPGESMMVRVPPGTQVVEVTFTSTSPEAAAAGSQAFSEAYLAVRLERAEATQVALLDNLRTQADAADQSLRDAAEAPDTTLARQQIELFTQRLAQLNEQISLAESVATEPGRVINPAELPTSSNEVPLGVLMLGGVLFGLLAGLAIAVFREWQRDLIRDSEQAEVGGLPVFASLQPNALGTMVAQRSDPVAYEEYRRLLAGVVANGARPQVLAVAAVDGGAHVSDIVANLAAALAEARFSVLVIAADPVDRGVERTFGVPQSPGLSEIVRTDIGADDVLHRSHDVDVLPSGSRPETVRRLYAGPDFRAIVATYRPRYDYVLLAAASAGTGDGDAVIGAADSVLLSVTSSKTTRGQVGAALARLGRLGINPIGAVPTPESQYSMGSSAADTDPDLFDLRRTLSKIWPAAEIAVRRQPALFNAGESYLMLPSRGAPTRLLPAAPRKMLLAAANGHGAATDRRAKLQGLLLRSVARVGAGVLVPNTLRIREQAAPTDGVARNLVEHLGQELERDLTAGIFLGPPRANRKPNLQLIDERARTVAFAKVGVNPLTNDRIRSETDALDRLADAELDVLRVPWILARGTWRESEYVAISPLPRAKERVDDPDLRHQAMRELVAAFPTADERLSDMVWWNEWSRRLDAFADDRDRGPRSDADELREYAAQLEKSCGSRVLGTGAAHGDWTPWNMDIIDGQAAVWDWERFDDNVPIGWDALHFEFQARVRLKRQAPRAALRSMSQDSEELVVRNGGYADDGPLLMALYALRLGSRFVVDGQERAGAKKGPLATWLLPEMDRLVEEADSASAGAA
ncbi:MAG: hypothetical protein AB8G26_08085 [Ilumatobacter sp.]